MAVTALHQWLVPVILSLNQVSYSSPKLCFLIQVTLKLHVNRKDVGCFCLLQYLCALKSCSTCKSHSKHCVLWCWATSADPRKSPLSFLFIHVLHKGKFVVWHESIQGFRGSPDCLRITLSDVWHRKCSSGDTCLIHSVYFPVFIHYRLHNLLCSYSFVSYNSNSFSLYHKWSNLFPHEFDVFVVP